ncbi:unnamed protein product [Ilex paraguariensis]|uniref:MORF/ORRM1/DAG-like MORF domain-containing protein n=1 Tax=Ilex paraguariensis TaxID=185542 RepID=A0ABC8S099_9AQUA
MAAATWNVSLISPKTLVFNGCSYRGTNPNQSPIPSVPKPSPTPSLQLVSSFRFNSLLTQFPARPHSTPRAAASPIRAGLDSEYSSRRSSSNEPRETILLPGCDYNHWLIVMEFRKDPAPTREQMIETYLNTLATVLGSMEEAKKNMYAFSTTTYTGFQCTVDEATSEKFKGLPGVLWCCLIHTLMLRIRIMEGINTSMEK